MRVGLPHDKTQAPGPRHLNAKRQGLSEMNEGKKGVEKISFMDGMEYRMGPDNEPFHLKEN